MAGKLVRHRLCTSTWQQEKELLSTPDVSTVAKQLGEQSITLLVGEMHVLLREGWERPRRF